MELSRVCLNLFLRYFLYLFISLLFSCNTMTTEQTDIPREKTRVDGLQHQLAEYIANSLTISSARSGGQSDRAHGKHQIITTSPKVEIEELHRSYCPSLVQCNKLGASCIDCNFSQVCKYGQEVNITCMAKAGVNCTGERKFTVTMNCCYCYQTEPSQHTCTETTNCHVVSSPRQYYVSNCTMKDHIMCLGERIFKKKVLCNWTGGYRWTNALVLSITLGGFGVDRFYLGSWREGIGKLFSFGGLGVWTIVDVILIAIGYIGPADHSLYVW